MESDRIRLNPFCLSLGAVCAVEIAGGLLPSLNRPYPLILIGGMRILEILLLLVVFIRCDNTLAPIGLGRGQWFGGIRSGVLWSIGFGALVFGVSVLALVAGYNPLKLFQSRMPKQELEILLYFAVGGVIGPIAEEILFRGVVYGFFRRWGIVCGILISSGAFVVLHRGFGLTQMIGGVLFALAYEREGKLMAPIVVHVSGNCALFALSILANS